MFILFFVSGYIAVVVLFYSILVPDFVLCAALCNTVFRKVLYTVNTF